MRVLICFVSTHHGNTAKLARAMAGAIDADLADVATPDALDPQTPLGYDLIGFGSGIYAFRHHPRLLQFASSLQAPASASAFIFSTRGLRPRGPYHLILRRRLRARGWSVVGEYSCLGLDTFGPFGLIGGINRGRPNDDDLSRATEFAKNMVARAAQRSERSAK